MTKDTHNTEKILGCLQSEGRNWEEDQASYQPLGAEACPCPVSLPHRADNVANSLHKRRPQPGLRPGLHSRPCLSGGRWAQMLRG